jgi:hypothetical protein
VAGDKGNRVWEEVRRAMGRLTNRAAVHELLPQNSFQVVVQHSVAASPLTATAGTQESIWSPQTETVRWPLPYAEEGGDGADFSSVATVISANGALDASPGLVQCPPWRVESGHLSQAWDFPQAVLAMPNVAAPSVQLNGAVVQGTFTPVVRGGVHLVAVPRLALEKRRVPSWAFSRPRSRSDLGVLARVPIIRESMASPPGQSPHEAFAAARLQLASAPHISESDVVLVGLFPQVPLNMVQKLSVIVDGGAKLQIWLKPDAIRNGPGGAKLATIILGRQRSTGRTLQAVSRTPNPGVRER